MIQSDQLNKYLYFINFPKTPKRIKYDLTQTLKQNNKD